jgi:hypothetical protein
MSITNSLPPEMEEKLRQRAAERGQTVDGYVRQLVEREVLGTNDGRTGAAPPSAPRLPSDEALAPFRNEVAESGMTDDELLEFFEGLREKVYPRLLQGSPCPPAPPGYDERRPG